MSKVEALKSGAQGFANAVKRFAVKDKQFAEELVYMHGIRSEITPNALKPITKDMFDKAGKMTKNGKKQVTAQIKELGLHKNATWDEILEAVKVKKAEMAKKLSKLEVPKFEILDKDKLLERAGKKAIKLPKFDWQKFKKEILCK